MAALFAFAARRSRRREPIIEYSINVQGPRRRSTAALTGDTPGVSTADIFHNLASLERAGDRRA